MLGEKPIPGSKLLHEGEEKVIPTCTPANNYVVSLEKLISFVAWEEKQVALRKKFNRNPHGDFLVVLQVCLVWPDELAKVQ